MKSLIAAAGLAAVAQAFTQPVQPPTYGSLLTPDTSSAVTTGQDFTITWTPKQPADGVTVSLVLCKGPSTNCVLQDTAIVEGVPAAQASYTWSVPCSLPEGVQATETGYGMLIIVDGTGEFQYSTQFSVQKGDTCSSSTTTTSSSSGSSSSSSSVSGPPSKPTTSSGWYSWSTSTTASVPAGTATSKYTPAPVTSPAAQTSAYEKPSSSSAAAASTYVAPKPFTGAAAMPTAFANAAGIVGAAALAMFAL